MDIVPTLTAFLVGTATGAAGQYFAMKYTDRRQEGEKRKAADDIWKEFEARFPRIAEEMREDFSNPEHMHFRAFFVKKSKERLNGSPEPAFEYHTDEHDHIKGAVMYLQEHQFVSDITPGNCPMYRIHEKLAARLVPQEK